ncbi:MAG: thiamine pyrophosphate-binding protein [Thermomicrobiales bacterium]|nr:thiamine pyrophosphate-binding protein [Thermomicrobiales bacterium]
MNQLQTAARSSPPVTTLPGVHKLTGGEAVVASLVAHGVETIFALPGIQLDGLFAALYDARDSLRVIHTRHEQAVAYMADGYARVSGKEGVAIVVPGPGVLNAAAGLATAYACNSPVLCLAGQVRSDLIDAGRGALHEIPNQIGVLGSVTKHTARIPAPRAVPQTVAEAFRQLRTGRTRPVALEIAPDVLLAKEEVLLPAVAAARERLTGNPDAIEHAARVLGAATSPVIVAGGGVLRSGASDDLLDLAELLQAPVLTSRNGKGAVSDRHYLAQGPVVAGDLLATADAVLVVGTRFPDVGEPAPPLGANTRVVHLDVDAAEFGRFGPDAIEIHADARLGLAALGNRLARVNRRRPSRRLELTTLKEAAAQRVNAINPQAGYALAIRAELPDEGILVSEFTQVGYWSYLGYPVYQPNTFITPGYQGTLGYGFTTAMGVQVGKPGTPVISINGDGGFGYTLNELSTLVQHDIPLVSVVFNDNAYGNVRRIQQQEFGGRVIASELVNPNYRKLAEAFGVAARRAASPAALRVQLREALRAQEPTLIEVPIGPTPNPWRTLGLR